MIRSIFAVVICTLILGILFAMPVVPEFPAEWIAPLSWLADQLAFADRFIDAYTLIELAGLIILFEVALFALRISLWAINKFR